MKVFIMRHGEAEHYAASDDKRALTKRGLSESVAVARACAERQRHFDKALVSPYIRAQQTWQAISKYVQAEQVETNNEITPYGQAESTFDYLSALIEVEQLESLLLVSHLPLVGYLVSEFVRDMVPPMFPTSGIICIEYDPVLRNGQVLWNIHP